MNHTHEAVENQYDKDQIAQAIERAKRGFAHTQQRIDIVENGIQRTLTVERRGVGPVHTSFGIFELYSFQVSDQWRKYTALVMANKFEQLVPFFAKDKKLIVRFDSGCETGQIFGDLTCECREQLELGLEQIAENGQGILINIPHQDGRGLGLPFKLATLRLQNEIGVDTVQASKLLQPNGSRDDRTYAGAIAILRFFGINQPITLSTNNPKKQSDFRENGFDCNAMPAVVPPTAYTKRHLEAKATHLGHVGIGELTPNSCELNKSFIDKLRDSVSRNDSFLCCGLDPIKSMMPANLLERNRSDAIVALQFMRTVIDKTKHLVCAYKIQKAFFDLLLDGEKTLKAIISHIHTVAPGMPIIIDAKTGDIENTMEAYLQYFFSVLDVDAIIVNPYMGEDVFTPFKRYPNKAGIVLARTSNSGAAIVQDRILDNGMPVWTAIFQMVETRWNAGEAFFPVISSTSNLPFSEIAIQTPEMPLFLAGMGAQGGNLAVLSPLLTANPNRIVLVNSSRAILYSTEKHVDEWENSIEYRATDLRDKINEYRRPGMTG